MFVRSFVLGGTIASAVALHSSLETVLMDTILGVAIAIAVFVLYYALVLRRARDDRGPDP